MTALAFSVFAFLLFSNYLDAIAFLSPGAAMPFAGSVQEGVSRGIILPVSVLAAVASFILFMAMSYGAPAGGVLPLSFVFENPKELFSLIRESRFSLKSLIRLTLAASFFWALFSTASEYLFLEASLGWLKGVEPLSLQISAEYMPPVGAWVARFVSSFLGGVVSSFAPAFAAYWLLRLLSLRTEYLKLYALTLYSSLVPLAFSAALTVFGFAAHYAIGRTSPVSMAFLPYAGSLLSCGILAYGIRDVCGASSRKAFLVVLPLLVFFLLVIYVKYVMLFTVPERILQVMLYQLGVYST